MYLLLASITVLLLSIILQYYDWYYNTTTLLLSHHILLLCIGILLGLHKLYNEDDIDRFDYNKKYMIKYIKNKLINYKLINSEFITYDYCLLIHSYFNRINELLALLKHKHIKRCLYRQLDNKTVSVTIPDSYKEFTIMPKTNSIILITDYLSYLCIYGKYKMKISINIKKSITLLNIMNYSHKTKFNITGTLVILHLNSCTNKPIFKLPKIDELQLPLNIKYISIKYIKYIKCTYNEILIHSSTIVYINNMN